jgi:hypothetical protein
MPHRRLLVLGAAAILALVLAIPASAAGRNHPAAPAALYYASYGPTQPLARPAPARAALPVSGSGPGWTLAIVAGAALLAGGAIAGRVSVRRPRAAM